MADPGQQRIVTPRLGQHNPRPQRLPEFCRQRQCRRVSLRRRRQQAGAPIEKIGPGKLHPRLFRARHRMRTNEKNLGRQRPLPRRHDSRLDASHVGHERSRPDQRRQFGQPLANPPRRHRQDHRVRPAQRRRRVSAGFINGAHFSPPLQALRRTPQADDMPRQAAHLRAQAHRAAKQAHPVDYHSLKRQDCHEIPLRSRRSKIGANATNSGI